MNGSVAEIKGCERLLTAGDVAALIGKPARFVRKELLEPGILKGKKFGGNSWRVDPKEFRRFVERGETGFRHAPPSSCWERGPDGRPRRKGSVRSG